MCVQIVSICHVQQKRGARFLRCLFNLFKKNFIFVLKFEFMLSKIILTIATLYQIVTLEIIKTKTEQQS